MPYPFVRAALALSPIGSASWLTGRLKVHDRTIRRWIAGEEIPSEGIFRALVELLEKRQAECAGAIVEIKALLASGTLRPANPPQGDRPERQPDFSRGHTPRDFDEGL